MASKNSCILFVSDPHAPYMHPDTLEFLKHLKDLYDPTRVIFLGDETDGHAISFHDHDPDLMSPSDEFKKAIEQLKPLYKLFPEADILESNHGSLVYRKGKSMGLPRHVFKSYREILEAPQKWKWHKDLTLLLPDGSYLYACHGKGPSLKLSQSLGMHVIQGHFHEKFSVEYWSTPIKTHWAVHSGCLIDDEALAFNYNKINIKRPILGTTVVVNGQPILEIMELDSKGRWKK